MKNVCGWLVRDRTFVSRENVQCVCYVHGSIKLQRDCAVVVPYDSWSQARMISSN
jgi:hypothetical protein